MVQWQTAFQDAEPDAMSPGGVSEIRHLIGRDYGDLTHVRVPAGGVSAPAWLEVAEFFYVWAGRGQLWRKRGGREDVIDLRPGTCASVLAGTIFQYRAQDEDTVASDLIVILAVVPHWQLPLYHHADVEPRWPPTRAGRQLDPPPGRHADLTDDDLGPVVQLPGEYDVLAPDGSEIRLLPAVESASLAHCQLPPGSISTAVRHRTVSETWFVLDGAGELWRSSGQDQDHHEEVTSLRHGVAVDIPLGTTFQFRATGNNPLQMLLLTAPKWPGPHEAVTGSVQRWPTLRPDLDDEAIGTRTHPGEILSGDGRPSEYPVPHRPIRVLPVDLDILSSFLEGDPASVQGGVIDLQTGDVIPRGDYFEDLDGIFDEDGEADPDRYLWFDNNGSHAGWQDMADFAATVPDERLRYRLERALHGRGPFRRFRDVIHDADLGRAFHAYADERLQVRALEFLHDANIWLPDEQPPRL